MWANEITVEMWDKNCTRPGMFQANQPSKILPTSQGFLSCIWLVLNCAGLCGDDGYICCLLPVLLVAWMKNWPWVSSKMARDACIAVVPYLCSILFILLLELWIYGMRMWKVGNFSIMTESYCLVAPERHPFIKGFHELYFVKVTLSLQTPEYYLLL